ncbi:hypothetical protein Tco_1047984, partial [Tanacetum coccineum]
PDQYGRAGWITGQNNGLPGRHVAGDTNPGRHVARDNLKGKARQGILFPETTFRAIGRDTRVIQSKLICDRLESIPGRHVDPGSVVL